MAHFDQMPGIVVQHIILGRGRVVRRQRIGENTHAHATLHCRFEGGLHALAGHKIGRDDQQLFACITQQRYQAIHHRIRAGTVAGVAGFGQRAQLVQALVLQHAGRCAERVGLPIRIDRRY